MCVFVCVCVCVCVCVYIYVFMDNLMTVACFLFGEPSKNIKSNSTNLLLL